MSPQALQVAALAVGLAAASSLRAADTSAPPPLAIDGPAQVTQFERIAFVIGSVPACRNPYDSDEIQVGLEITAPSGVKLSVPAFFQQPFEWRSVDRGGRKTEWIYPTGQAGWRARFAPTEAGRYSATVQVKRSSGADRFGRVVFECVTRTSRGFVRVSQRDPRFFEFGDGSPYFPIGQNVAFIGDGQHLDGERAAGVFRNMSEHGANWARVWTCCEDWAMAIEARKSVWGRSWNWRPPFAPMPGADGTNAPRCVVLGGSGASSLAVTPSHAVPLRPGTAYVLTGRVLTESNASFTIEAQRGALGEAVRSAGQGQWASFERPFTAGANQWWLGDLRLRSAGEGRVWLADLSLRETGGGPELLWEAEVNRPLRGVYNQPDCFLLDRLVEAAEKHGIYLQLCLFTRDLYRSALRDPQSTEYQRAIDDAKKFLRYAVARWGHSTSVFAWEYFNEMDPGAPTDRFYRELGGFLEQIDVYRHLRTVSAWSPAPKYWAQASLDIADLHWYLRPISKPAWQDEVAGVLDRAKLLREGAPSKPALLAEFGLADDKWGRSPYMPQDKAGVHFHNALWASAFSGLSGTAMFWWWETLDQNDLYRHYRPLAAFLADVPFTTAQLRPASLTTEKQARAFAWRGQDRAYVWLHHPQATWWNVVAEKKSPPEIAGDSLSLDGLTDGTYRLEWWDTNTGQVTQRKTVSVSGGKLTVPVPVFTSDAACKLVKEGK
ncbi:MAG: DUF5060 domain-containing protein [Verrucomicrobia bacterium]|nr:DUF5060 domain-containing protein [Verrucomicrobiota bacterium]